MTLGETVKTAWRHFTGYQGDIETVVERFEADDRLEMRDDSRADTDGTVEEKVAEGTENGVHTWRGYLKYELEDNAFPARIEFRWPATYGQRVDGIGVSVEAGFEPYDIFSQEDYSPNLHQIATASVPVGADQELIDTVRDRFVTLLEAYEDPDRYV